MLTKLSENACSRFRMEEGDIQTLCTLTGSLVNQTNTLFTNFCQCVSHAVFNAECNVMNPLVTLVEPLLNSALR